MSELRINFRFKAAWLLWIFLCVTAANQCKLFFAEEIDAVLSAAKLTDAFPFADGSTTRNRTTDAAGKGEEAAGTPPASSPPTSNAPAVAAPLVAFERQEGVVIATKIHEGLPHMLEMLEQMLCLLHHAYNHLPLYDIVVFSAVPIEEEAQNRTRSLVFPANVTFVVDNRGLQEEIAALSPERRRNFLESCNVTDPGNLTWYSECPGRIAYNWQAEFRSWQIWKQPALAPYRYMLWMDADAFSTKPWPQDPIKTMIENDLVILFDHFPQGRSRGSDVTDRIQRAFDVHLCSLSVVNGTMSSVLGPGDGSGCKTKSVPLVHGFFHITNLDFFRSDAVQKFEEIWIGDGFLQRKFDDQAAVTIPPAILAPDRAWEMRSNGIHLEVFHNLHLDGIDKVRNPIGPSFIKFWRNKGSQALPTAAGVCPIKAGSR